MPRIFVMLLLLLLRQHSAVATPTPGNFADAAETIDVPPEHRAPPPGAAAAAPAPPIPPGVVAHLPGFGPRPPLLAAAAPLPRAYIGGNVSALNCTDCCLPECLAEENDGGDGGDSVVVPAQKQSSLSATCRPKTSSSLNCNNTCSECSSQVTAQQPSSKLTTTTPSTTPSSILPPLTGIQMKLQHLTGAATNCC
ncbi:PREDICTED: mucin-7 [Rhagoletis zephyria]|uniref:mucin-7 n=1 Tax=Rhagoletis zephyria TaxID=28612 RepID=UPI0008117BB8|nr:PREDICTED: mucin-7 [Rhagoletis zephyria]